MTPGVSRHGKASGGTQAKGLGNESSPAVPRKKTGRNNATGSTGKNGTEPSKKATGAAGKKVAKLAPPGTTGTAMAKRHSYGKHPRPAGWGTLKLNSEPFAIVYWRGKKLGPTPLLGVRLPVGSHTLVLRNPALGIVKKIRVKIERGKEHKMFIDLAKAK